MKKFVNIISFVFISIGLLSCGGGGYVGSDYDSGDYKWYVAGNHPGKNVAFDDYLACMHIAKQLYENPKCVFEYDRYKKEKEERNNQQTNTTKTKDTYWLVQTMPYKKLGTYNSLQSCVRAQTFLRIENRKIKTFCSLRPK